MSEPPNNPHASLGVVVIARNGGERLRLCLESLRDAPAPVLYIDSASTDGSPDLARSLDIPVLELNPATPLSAARARNEGFERLFQEHPELELIQFVDGDCMIDPDWFSLSQSEMAKDGSIAALCGRVREAYPKASIYARLCDMEWNVPAGDAAHCGGIFLCRASTFLEVGGFDEALFAGEEPDLCARMRALGGRILRIDAPMATHDAQMTRFSQWWKRAIRGGHGTALLAQRNGWSLAAVRPFLSCVLWGLVIPTLFVLGAIVAIWQPWAIWLSVAAMLGWLALIARISLRRTLAGTPMFDSILYAIFCLVAKPAQLIGLLRWARTHAAP